QQLLRAFMFEGLAEHRPVHLDLAGEQPFRVGDEAVDHWPSPSLRSLKPTHQRWVKRPGTSLGRGKRQAGAAARALGKTLSSVGKFPANLKCSGVLHDRRRTQSRVKGDTSNESP